MINVVDDFYNKVLKELDEKYFPDVKYYRDNKSTTKIHYLNELFNNGCLTYDRLIKGFATCCKDTEQNIHTIVSKYVTDFGEYKPSF